MVVEQYLSGFHAGDAVGDSVRRFHRFLLGRGVASRVVALTIDPALRGQAVLLDDHRPAARAVKVYHFAIASPLSEWFLRQPGRKALLYHNVTPGRFFAAFSEPLRRLTESARVELRELVAQGRHFIADSRYNADELRELGAADVFVFPVMVDEEEMDGPVSATFAASLRDGRRNLLFVGRVTPNKRIEDLRKLAAICKRQHGLALRLIVAGNTATLPSYHASLLGLAARLGLDSRDRVFTGHLPREELLAAYGAADLFVTLSEHEGFCLPLIESCRFGLPVLAYDAGAVAETLGGAGVLLKEKDLTAAAALVERLLADAGLRRGLAAAGRRRGQEYREQARPERLLAYLEAL